MDQANAFRLSGVALSAHPRRMLDEIAEHFVEHATVEQAEGEVTMTSELGSASIRLSAPKLLIELACPTDAALQMARTNLAEHMFYFAGEDAFELNWSQPAAGGTLPNLREVTVVGAEDITPRMRRVRFVCEYIAPFVGGQMHVRILIPPAGRKPVWPGYRADGRLAWPTGEDELTVRVYTIRAVDVARRELWVDFLQHPAPGVETPGADFAMNAQPGDVVAFLGPGAGGLPEASEILMIGDEAALPGIARIAAEVPAGTAIRAIVEVEDAAEEQKLPSAGTVDVQWLHRRGHVGSGPGRLLEAATAAIAAAAPDSFVWAACERTDIRAIRRLLAQRGHDRALSYVAWFWER